MKKIIMISLASLVLSSAFGQDVYQRAATFLNIPTDARTAALGGASVAVAGNSYAVSNNPATSLMDYERYGGVAYSFAPWMSNHKSGYSLNTMGGFYKIDDIQSVLAGLRTYSYPRIDRISEEGSYRPTEWTIELGYAREISPGFSLGITGRFINSDLASGEDKSNSNAAAADIGLVYFRPVYSLGGTWAVGLKLSNIGSKIKYLGTKEHLPAMIKLGGSITLPFGNHSLMAAADGGYAPYPSENTFFDVSGGIEYSYRGNYFIRGGYHGTESKGGENYPTAGAGINFYGAHLDFTYLFAKSDSPLKDTFWFTLGFGF